ncbi:MAG: hypothetical protein H5T86_06940, partial [Armatimonadetes bacterium]|nr:hypothetical protein [Armatimonadota bacterium]
YVDRKLFIHNLGHACCAYFAAAEHPEMVYIWQAAEHPLIAEAARRAMWESGRALMVAYPEEFNEENMREHIEDLLRRFRNRALGDTIYRVGRDVPRKLGRDDRIIGAMLFDLNHSVDPHLTAYVAAAAMRFRGTDEHGEMYEPDKRFAEEIWPRGIDFVLAEVCGLDRSQPLDARVWDMVMAANRHAAPLWERGDSVLAELMRR